MRPTAIVLFARSPEREAAAKGMRAAAPLFGAVIGAWLEAARTHGAMPVIACADEDRAALAAIAPHVGRGWLEQRGERFGARVAAAACDAFALGYARVIIAAIDAPPPSDLGRTLDVLARGVNVIAPARDGGINFIGVTSPERELLERFTPRRRDLVRLCRAHFDALLVLRVATDIDSPSALDAARRERAWRAFVPPRILEHAALAAPLIHRITPALPPRAPPA
jgi:glycosyltransferase A (GT-A) superfamily protein (DUF2064 family)